MDRQLYWLVPPSRLAQQLSYSTQDNLSRGGTIHNGLGPPTYNNHQEHAPQITQANLVGAFSQLKFSLPK